MTTPADLMPWTTCAEVRGWRVQHNRSFEATGVLQAWRLIDPEAQPWAVAFDLEGLQEELPALFRGVDGQRPLLSRDDATQLLKALVAHQQRSEAGPASGV